MKNRKGLECELWSLPWVWQATKGVGRDYVHCHFAWCNVVSFCIGFQRNSHKKVSHFSTVFKCFWQHPHTFPIVITQNYQDFLHMIPTELPQYCNAFDSVFPPFESNMICTVIPTTLPHLSYIGFHIVWASEKLIYISNAYLYPSKFCWIFSYI